MGERPSEFLITALKQALAEPGERRLFRSGKLPGLFASKTGAAAEVAFAALRDGLFEITRTETKGKIAIDWVEITPKGVEFLHAHESPLAGTASKKLPPTKSQRSTTPASSRLCRAVSMT